MKRHFAFLCFVFLLALRTSSQAARAEHVRADAQIAPITMQVDAREAPRRILHAQLHIPVTPGPLTLFYPEWLPGTHQPAGTISNLVGLRMAAGQKPLRWRRDEVCPYKFHLAVPSGATALDVSFDYVTPSSGGGYVFDPASTDQLLILNWNLVALYPAGRPAAQYVYKPILLLPDRWHLFTTLPVANQSGSKAEFKPVSLDRLVDSPVIAGAHYRAVRLPVSGSPPAEIDIVADHESALAISQKLIDACTRLMNEAMALFGGYHYTQYRFLLTLSDHVTPLGLEHHESSDDRYAERALTDERMTTDVVGGNLAHELAHSWNGKYRRPQGEVNRDYQQPINTELVWVYEGLTEYLGRVLHARAQMGLQTEQFREGIASSAAEMDYTAGRRWRPLIDTAVAMGKFSEESPEWASWRRDGDFYDEGALIWLEADLIIRQRSAGRRSLDDFCRAFFGPPSGPPLVKPYTLADIIATLTHIVPYDWSGFFQKRVYDVAPRVSLDTLERSGWKLIYDAKPNYWDQSDQQRSHVTDLSYSIGMVVRQTQDGKDGVISDVIPGMPAAEAGIAPGMELVAVDGKPWSPEDLVAGVKTSSGRPGMELQVRNDGFLRTYNLKYGGGLRYAHLERVGSHEDLLGEITKPRLVSPITSH